MLPGQEDSVLRNAVKTVMAQIFKFGLFHNCELLIEGTIGVTVDRHRVIVIHFDEKLSQTDDNTSTGGQAEQVLPSFCTSDENCTTDSHRVSAAEMLSPSSLQSCFSASWLGMSGIGEAANKDTNASSCKQNSFDSSKMMRCFQDSAASDPQMFNPTLNESIAIDSDSDSFNSIQLDDTEMSDEINESKQFGKTLSRICTDTKIAMKKKKKYKQKKVLGQRSASSIDCENMADVSESRSLFSDFSPNVQHLEEEVDTKNGFGRKGSDGKHVCEICGQMVNSVCQLEAHLVCKHGVVESSQLGKITHFLCQVCKKRYRFQAQLDKHMLVHESDRPYQCKLCRNAYRCEESLLLHRQVHKNNLKCGLCMKSYTSKVLFQKHIAYMHEKVKDGKV